MLRDKFFFIATCYLLAISSVSARPGDESDESKEDNDDLDDDCKLPPVQPGPFACMGHFPKWTFDSKSGNCKPYVYGGCRGTKNLFSSEQDCIAKCGKKSSKAKSADSSAVPPPCSLPLARGTCRAFIPSYYFDSTSNKCVEFVFTGCGGNANNFITREDCEKTCSPEPAPTSGTKGVKSNKPDTAADQQDICNLPPEAHSSGIRCMAFIPSWTFNSTSGQCERYIYGGCGKTANLFKTEDACNAVCGLATRMNRESCLLPVDKGPCLGMATRYAFIKEKNRCEPFTYGLCQGNKNNFRTADECFKQCGGELPASADSECQNVVCPVTNKRYIERGCRPEYKGKACCPTSFTCPQEKTSATCLYRGLTFKVGQAVPQVTEDHPCKTQCACIASSEHQGGATIKCSETVCPAPKPPKNNVNCVLVTKANQCCPKFECEDNSSEEKETTYCSLKGRRYKKGENVPTGDSCRTCTCTKGFNGLNGPGCRDVHCLIDNRKGCVPVYTENVCCPTSYRCVDDSAVNKSRIIRVDSESGQQAAVTLPFSLSNNRNNQEVKADFCLLPKEAGPCRMYSTVFHYDSEHQKCLPFAFGGCKGNANKFDSEEACMAACHVTELDGQQQQQQSRTSDLTASANLPAVFGAGSRHETPRPQRCNFPMNTGPCRMSLEMFYYDEQAQDCRLFYYGGCKGNPNRFESIEECRRTCLVSDAIDEGQELQQVAQNQLPSILEATTTTTEAPPVNICELPQEEGPCKGHVKAFSFNWVTGKCEAFWYGGCRGNANRFETKQECMQRCGSPAASSSVSLVKARSEDDSRARCKLPSDVGFCRAFTERFYYDDAEQRCKLFSWGGCMGNSNNFATAQECLAACRPPRNPTGAAPEDDTLPAGRARARAPARARGQVEDPVDNVILVKESEPVCSLLNVTLKLGDKIETGDPCDECICITPPEVSCRRLTCPTELLMSDPSLVCHLVPVPGQCCPQVNCVPAVAPSVTPCEVEMLSCPKMPQDPTMLCTEKHIPGRCCPDFECVSAEPPTVTPCEVERLTCPQMPDDPSMVCEEKYVPGVCCPDFECVSANPPAVDPQQFIEVHDPCTEECREPPKNPFVKCEPIYQTGQCCPTYSCVPKPAANKSPTNCNEQECPVPPNDPEMICKPNYMPDRCCPDYSCVSANPPFIDVCEGVVCQSSEHCEVREQESLDGNWKPPVGVCISNE